MILILEELRKQTALLEKIVRRSAVVEIAPPTGDVIEVGDTIEVTGLLGASNTFFDIGHRGTVVGHYGSGTDGFEVNFNVQGQPVKDGGIWWISSDNFKLIAKGAQTC